MNRRQRVLFVAEDVSLAQVVRLFVLARSLDPSRYEVHFACARFDPRIFRGGDFARHPIFSLDRQRVLRAAKRGQRLYDERVLARYVDEELTLFRALRPDVVVGDLRFSLCISAPHAGVPYAPLINAYWARPRSEFPLPDHPILRLLGERLSARYFPRALPSVLARFAEPVNRLRRRYGLSPFADLIDVLMYGDLVLFPDVPWLTPYAQLPPRHVFLGPVLWSPEQAAPEWWASAPRAPRPLYVTLGSSGRVDRLPCAIEGLARLGRPLWVATAGRCSLDAPPGVFTADLLPGSAAAQRAELVVCNGGSSTAYQALAEGRPVLGIASNLDQFLAMSAIAERGCGVLLRASTLTAAGVEQAARTLMEQPSYRLAAERAQRELGAYEAAVRFEAALRSLARESRSL